MRIARALWIVPALLALLSTPAIADDTFEKTRVRTGAAVLAHIDHKRIDSSWLSGELGRVHLHKRRGLSYTRALGARQRGLELSLQGPAVGAKKAVGLGFELRF